MQRLLYSSPVFHFWVERGTLDSWDMYTLNDNFAHIGDLVNIDNSRVALVGTSVKALSSEAEKQKENVFVQIFDPLKDLGNAESYFTEGERNGLSGGNGDETVTDYGIKWLTNKNIASENAQAAYDGKGHIIVLFEQREKVYYMVLDTSGEIIIDRTLFSKKAMLNACETPKVKDGTLYWTGNRLGDYRNNMYIYSLKIN